MPVTLVQTVNPSVSTGPITASLNQTKQGSLILVFVGCSALTDSVSTVTDNANNIYTKAYAVILGSAGDTELWYSANSSPANSVVVTFSGSITTKSVFVREYFGIFANLALDKTGSINGSGVAPSTGATAPTTEAIELVVSNCVCVGTSPTLSVGSGFGNYISQPLLSNLSLHSIQDLVTSSIGTQNGTMTAGGTLPFWSVGVATFRVTIPVAMNNYQFVDTGDGMSATEKIR